MSMVLDKNSFMAFHFISGSFDDDDDDDEGV